MMECLAFLTKYQATKIWQELFVIVANQKGPELNSILMIAPENILLKLVYLLTAGILCNYLLIEFQLYHYMRLMNLVCITDIYISLS